MGVWSTFSEQGYECLLGENEQLAVRVVPARGSKIISLTDKRTGREWIHQTDRPWEPLSYGMNWDDGDRGGWDEMFPTINACPCPDEPWLDANFPDHGEVWCLPWQYEQEGDTLRLTVEGVQVPYQLTKTISLNGSELIIDYRLENPTPHVFSYLWAAHPLLRIQPGMKLSTEPPNGRIHISYSHQDRLGKTLEYNEYPAATSVNGNTIDLSIIENKSSQSAEKYYFSEPLQEGYAGLSDPASGEEISFRFSPEENPYLAIWANYGGFDDYTFAIEPASGYLDDVYKAKQLGKVKQIEGLSVNSWTLRVSLEHL